MNSYQVKSKNNNAQKVQRPSQKIGEKEIRGSSGGEKEAPKNYDTIDVQAPVQTKPLSELSVDDSIHRLE